MTPGGEREGQPCPLEARVAGDEHAHALNPSRDRYRGSVTAVPGHALERIVVVPVNGYGNRLQAWASAHALGVDLGVPVQVLWEPEPVAAASAADLFSHDLLARSFIGTAEVEGLLGASHVALPRYLVERGDALMLAGHDRGEQAFMGELEARLAMGRHRVLVIVAGGNFHLPRAGDPRERRRAFYRQLTWSERVSHRTHDAIRGAGRYIGLHVRGTDRSVTAPSERRLKGALARLAAQVDAPGVYVAADTRIARDRWAAICGSLGLEPRWLPDPELDRGARSGGIDAIADWRALASSLGLAYASDSTFGAEAVVASGTWGLSIGVRAPRPVQWGRRVRALALGPIRARQRASADSSQASTAAS